LSPWIQIPSAGIEISSPFAASTTPSVAIETNRSATSSGSRSSSVCSTIRGAIGSVVQIDVALEDGSEAVDVLCDLVDIHIGRQVDEVVVDLEHAFHDRAGVVGAPESIEYIAPCGLTCWTVVPWRRANAVSAPSW